MSWLLLEGMCGVVTGSSDTMLLPHAPPISRLASCPPARMLGGYAAELLLVDGRGRPSTTGPVYEEVLGHEGPSWSP